MAVACSLDCICSCKTWFPSYPPDKQEKAIESFAWFAPLSIFIRFQRDNKIDDRIIFCRDNGKRLCDFFLTSEAHYADPRHNEDMKGWVGGSFNAGTFDPANINPWLRKLKWPRVTEAQLRWVLVGRDDYRED
jgi:hypothetical protein